MYPALAFRLVPLVAALLLGGSAGRAAADDALPKLLVAPTAEAVIGGLLVQDEDLVLCELTGVGPGTTQCQWRTFLDGSAAGVDAGIEAVDHLPNGNLVLRINRDAGIPDLSLVKRKDLVLFIPSDPFTLPYTAGEWRLFLDGDQVKSSSDARVMDAVAVLADGECELQTPPTCDVLFSLARGAALGGVESDNEDILRCRPTAWSAGGAITACEYSLFLDSSAINGGGTGSFVGNLLAFELFTPDTLVFRTGNRSTLPSHDADRDLLRFRGTFGATPTGTVDLWFDASTAGLGTARLSAVGALAGTCGDGIVTPPFERCDDGQANGAPASLCSATCRVQGTCTGSGTACETAADCGPGEGCCGNAVVEGPEQCDDGNTVEDDLCASTCAENTGGVPVVGCEDATVVPAFVRRLALTDTRAVSEPGFDRWRTAGDFNLPAGAIDPDSEGASLFLTQAGPGTIYGPVLGAGQFVQAGKAARPRWSFRDREADVPGALGWRRGRFQQRGNKIPYALDGRNVAIPVDTTAPIRLRQTIRVGDDCATAVLDCTLNKSGKTLTCRSGAPTVPPTLPPTTTTSTTTTTTTTTTSTTTTTTPLPAGPTLRFEVGIGSSFCGAARGLDATAPFSGVVEDASSTALFDMSLNCLYLGGGNNTSVPGSINPDGSVSYFSTGVAGPNLFTIGPSDGTSRHDCTRGGSPGGGECANGSFGTDGQGSCVVDGDCGAGFEGTGVCRPRANCFFGPPLPIPNGALSTCVVNAITGDPVGTLDAATGEATVSLPLEARVSLTGQAQAPCPLCVNNVCQAGARKDLPCTPVGSLMTSPDCPPQTFLGAIGVTLAGLTTGTQVAVADENGKFCDPQANPGFHGHMNARRITQSGSPAGDLTGGDAKPATLAGTFCVPATGSGIIDFTADLPGPGSVSLFGSVQLLP